MPTTVHFATNRLLTGPADALASYGNGIVTPSSPAEVTYGTAFVEDAGLTADTVGAIKSIQNTGQGGFSQSAIDDLSDPGRNLLVFIHGFDNSFENAITRAAFNQQWLAASGVAAAETTVVAFSWPSLGRLLAFPLPLLPYWSDQTSAGQSGLHISAFFANLQPLIDSARAKGKRIFLMTHSMGNWALQAAVESWFAHGNGDAFLFDQVFLAAADEMYRTFEFPSDGRLSALSRLTKRISIYTSTNDQVLQFSNVINGMKRLGQDGPHDKFDLNRFPAKTYRMVDCSAFQDFHFDPGTSHQYYRRSPTVRANIAQAMGTPV